MGRRGPRGARGVVVPGAYAALFPGARKMLGFCTCDLPHRAADAVCIPHEYLAALEAGEPQLTGPRVLSSLVPTPAAVWDLGAVLAVHADDLVTTPEDANL